MINKRISKITMLTCLMLGGIVNAQEFYTCVPKKSWWSDVIRENVEKGMKNVKVENKFLVKEFKKTEISDFCFFSKVEISEGRYQVVFLDENLKVIEKKDFHVFRLGYFKVSGSCKYGFRTNTYFALEEGKKLFDILKLNKVDVNLVRLYKYE